jgi:hypothetical protein
MSISDAASRIGPKAGMTAAGEFGLPSDIEAAAALIGGSIAQHRQLQYEVSRYIELLLGELGTMARAADLKHLHYFLELTRQEAADQTKRCQIDL